MATFTLVRGETLLSDPFVVRRLACTTGTTAAAITHGGPGVPDEVIPVSTNANSSAVMSCTGSSATTVTLDSDTDSETCYVYCRWYRQNTDDGSSIGTS